MRNVFSPVFIVGNELLFYIFLFSMALIILLTFIFVIKEIKKK
jgi:hypothetical protein